jgi:mannose-6-phosphate isomerase-like protein (cupin superfamily)
MSLDRSLRAVPSAVALHVDAVRGKIRDLVRIVVLASGLGVCHMSNHAEGVAIVLGPEDGESYWQPLPSRGYVINKINPYTSPYDDFSIGIQILEPGAHVRRHAHERSHELLFCFRGTGSAEIAGKTFDVREETILLIGRGLQHKVTNTGSDQMRLLWLISPPGLEDWFRALGRPRRVGDPMPPAFERPANIKEIQAQQRFIASDEG